MNSASKLACLTVDLEQDYGDLCPTPAYDGLALIPSLLEFSRSNETPLSWFVQGNLFGGHPLDVGRVVAERGADVYLHGYSHSDPRTVDQVAEIRRGIVAFAAFCGRHPTGYRAPLGVISSTELRFLAGAGFLFDSSVFPTWRPGRFCHLGTANRPHMVGENGLLEIPFSVVGRFVPVPLSLSYLKLSGGFFRRMLREMPLPATVVIGMHLHDLEPLPSSQALAENRGRLDCWLLRRLYGGDSAVGWQILRELVTLLRSRDYLFLGMSELVTRYGIVRK